MYTYEEQRPQLWTEAGSRALIEVRDHVRDLLAKAGAFRLQEGISVLAGDSWIMLACIDRLVELGEIREITHASTPAQHRVFVAA